MIKSNKLVKSIFATSVALSATIATSSFAAPIVVPDAPQIAAKGFVLMDYHSGKVLAEKEMNTQLSPASLTKMMTSYVIALLVVLQKPIANIKKQKKLKPASHFMKSSPLA